MVVEHWTSCVLVACIGIRRTELTIVDSALGVTTIQHQSRRSFRQLPCSSRSHFGRRKLLFNSLSFQNDNCSRYLVRVYALIFFYLLIFWLGILLSKVERTGSSKHPPPCKLPMLLSARRSRMQTAGLL